MATSILSSAASPSFAMEEAYCFVCSRCTDHVAEHDALVEAGLAQYDTNGTVRRTAAWNDALAAQIAEREYQEYLAQIEREFGHPTS